MASEASIRVRGARAHNLKSVDLDIPRDRMTVMTGLSGSGKSTLAFDTVYAEGQRKYMESLSAYARQFLDQMQKPDVESIEGLPPTIAIEQRGSSHNPRSTVATTTEIYDYLRLLLARTGTPRCWHVDPASKAGTPKRCGHLISSQSASQIVDHVLALPEGTKLMILAPLIRGKKGHHREVFEGMQRQGFVRARADGRLIDLRELAAGEIGKDGTVFTTKVQRYQKHQIEAVIDRIVVRHETDQEEAHAEAGDEPSDVRSRIADSVELSLKLADGLVVISTINDDPGASGPAHTDQLFSEKYACPLHPECSLEDLEPRLFSFNSPYGACPACAGLGTVFEFDPELVIAERHLSLSDGLIEPWRKSGRRMNIFYNRLSRRFAKDFGVTPQTAFDDMPEDVQRILLHGSNPRDEAKHGAQFEGVIPNLQRRLETTDSEFIKQRLSSYLSEAGCEVCHGARLRDESLHVFLEADPADVHGVRHADPESYLNNETGQGRAWLNMDHVVNLTIEQAVVFFDALELPPEQAKIAEPILKEIKARLGFMRSVGLGYLNLNRTTGSLSGGEAQRIRLATQVGSGLVGCCYVLDEPTIGLHQRDNERLIATLRSLTDIGNTVLVVEHDEDTIRAADHLIDIGPGPGRHGGEVVAAGPLEEVVAHADSLTAKYLRGDLKVEVPAKRRKLDHKKPLKVKGATANNLKNVDAAFPLGGLLTVTGVSGSGKSTLVNQILMKGLKRELSGARVKPGAHKSIKGMESIDRVIEVDQSPIGRTPRSNPATYTGLFDSIRDLFTKTKEAKIRGYKPGRFSFNVKGGRCEACQGQGTKKIEMHFLPDVFVTCDVCKGARYNRETLEVTYRGKHIADVLNMTIEEALSFFESFPDVQRMLGALNDVGLSYIQLGQQSTTLSGGEAQRIKLATELGKRSTGRTLYVLDEPTTGLHFEDVRKLIGVLNRLVDEGTRSASDAVLKVGGNTVVLIEHNMDVIKCSDWLLDMGPEGGDRGGELVAEGTPEDVAANPASHTGRFLKPMLEAAPPAKKKPAGKKKVTKKRKAVKA